MPNLPQQRDSLQSSEVLFDALPLPITDGISRVLSRTSINREGLFSTVVPMCVQIRHEVSCYMKQMSLLLLLVPLCAALHAEDQQTARIGDLKLENGEVIRDCVVGYRTFGMLSSQKSNAVVYLTYLGGNSADLAGSIGAGKLVDSARYYVIVVDSLADGVSSSPSNSRTQPRLQFPKISIRDMVNAEHKMLTDSLHLTHVHAVMGFSMGGLQAFQWAVSYPEFMDKIVSIQGSPQLTSWDMLWLRTELLAVEADPDWDHGQYTTEPKLHLYDSVFALIYTTPEYFATKTPTKDFEKFFSEQVEDGSFDANDAVRQIQAVLTQDISASFGGSLERAAAAVRVPVLIIINRQDHVVNPMTSIRFATLLKTQALELDSNCGHKAFSCERAKISQAVSDFLQQ
jgi:homoserine O-acetyltransferase/O-succinyltransferase